MTMPNATGLRLQVEINGEARTVGGVPGFGVLSATVSWVTRGPRRLPPGMEGRDDEGAEIAFGGLDSSTGLHRRWLRQKLQAGDTVTIRVLPSGAYDPPVEEFSLGRKEGSVPDES